MKRIANLLLMHFNDKVCYGSFTFGRILRDSIAYGAVSFRDCGLATAGSKLAVRQNMKFY